MYIQIVNTLIIFMGILYSVILHEVAHGLVAYFFGDNTAKHSKRLSLNPLRHIDLFGSLILPFILYIMKLPIFGWAKPVPINPDLFTNRKLGMIFVSIAGVFVNFLLVILFFFIFSISEMDSFLVLASVNIMLFVFNLIPFPPLDGYRLLSQILPKSLTNWIEKNESVFLVIFLFLLASGLIRYIYSPVYNFFARLFLKIFIKEM